MAVKDYDIAAAFQAIEYELINSFFRNMKKHTVDEVTEQKEWEMWQVKQLQELAEYKKHNEKKYGTKFTRINKTIKEMIRLSNEQGQMDQEAQILDAIDKGLKPKRATEAMTGQFFVTNERKLDTLINATVSDMERAEVAVLRKANDVYRKTIFNAMVYANTGAGTYEKAVDMATKDFMKAGLTCIEYKNGSKHTISDYADMAIRTANKRAYLQGEGAKRQEWGVHTVIVNKRLAACPHCMPFAGKVFIDDVWGGGTAADGDYPLLSTAIEAGLYHPRCKDSHTAFFPGISDNPKRYTKKEIKEAEEAEKLEAKENLAKRQAVSQQRVANTRLDPENKRVEQARAHKMKSEINTIDGAGMKIDNREAAHKHPINQGIIKSNVNPIIKNDGTVKQTDVMRPYNIFKELKNSAIGRATLNYLNRNQVRIDIYYNADNPDRDSGIYDPTTDSIIVYGDVTKTILETARTIIHEATHRRLGCTLTRSEEVLCFMEELKHTKGKLTKDDVNVIVKLVNNNENYRMYSWGDFDVWDEKYME